MEIRYKRTDARAYRAAVANLSPVPGAKPLPDDACVDGEFVATAAAAKKSAGRKKGGSAAKTAGHAAAAVVHAADTWVAYTDGACSGNPGPAGSGAVLIRPGGRMSEGYEFLGTGTNNIAELTAIAIAARAVPKDAPLVVIHTDSKYAIGVLSQGWKAKANGELIARIKTELAGRRLKLVYVPGHSGVPLNERADELAREAIRTGKSQAL